MSRMLGNYRRSRCDPDSYFCRRYCRPDTEPTRRRKRQEAREVEKEVASEIAERIFTAREARELGRALREGRPVTFRPRYWPPGDSAPGRSRLPCIYGSGNRR